VHELYSGELVLESGEIILIKNIVSNAEEFIGIGEITSFLLLKRYI